MLFNSLLLLSNCCLNFRKLVLCGCHRFRHLRMCSRGVVSCECKSLCFPVLMQLRGFSAGVNTLACGVIDGLPLRRRG